jgi:transcriptional regulator with XRE-family HTH domain
MKSKNELFLDAVDYLIDEGLAIDQGDVAQQAGLGPNLISRVRNGHVKSVSDDSIRALASKFNLNMDYFRGKSDYITRYDQASASFDRDLKEVQRMTSAIDNSFMYEKAIKNIVAPVYNNLIDNLNKQVADKDHQIERLEKESDAKDKTIAMLNARIRELEAKVNQYENERSLKFPFEMGVSEHNDDLHTRV